jgi:hypothetical protein
VAGAEIVAGDLDPRAADVVLDVLDVAMHEIDFALHEIDQLGSILPDGYSLLAAVCGPDGQVGDLFIRDRSGQTSVVLGLPAEAVHHLERLLDVASADVEPARPRHRAPAPFSPPADGALLYRTIVEQCPVPLVVIGRGTTSVRSRKRPHCSSNGSSCSSASVVKAITTHSAPVAATA